MSSLFEALSAMANSGAFASGMHPSKSLWNMPGMRDAMMQRGIGQLPQVPQQVQAPNLYEYWRLLGEGKPVAFNRPDPLAALRAARIPFMGI